MRLKKAKKEVKAALEPYMHLLPHQFREGYKPIGGWAEIARKLRVADQELAALDQQMKEIKALEDGVLLFNAALAQAAGSNGDWVVQIGSCLTEDSVRALVRGNYRLKKGASPKEAEHISSAKYDLLQREPDFAANITTIDEVHPSDEMYRLIWKEIHKVITKAGCTFGNLSGLTTPTTLSTLAAVTG
jgi:hypothetical protein